MSSSAMQREPDFHRPWYPTALELFEKAAAGKRCRVLDVGGGAAEMAVLLRERGHTVEFVDIDENNVARARQLGFLAYRHDCNRPLTELFEPERYDAALLLEVIEHIVHTQVLLRSLWRCLRPGGFVVVTTPNVAHLWWRLRALLGHPPRGEGYHVRFFTYALLCRELHTAGFRIEREAHATSTFGLNAIRVLLGKPPVRLPFPKPLRGLFVRNFAVVARKSP
ncbi:MAG: class I SAM-dependent methyltransferase [Candidatus Kapabacteria bacterium]|nr:class I SAM-dependent methyltransferase [Candidatus Kapabacteria bacterium]